MVDTLTNSEQAIISHEQRNFMHKSPDIKGVRNFRSVSDGSDMKSWE
jgi:hypothetical protein